MVVSPIKAHAIGYDHGWTGGDNGDYPATNYNPECQPAGGGYGCWSLSDDLAQGHPYPDVNVVSQLGNALVFPSGSGYTDWLFNQVYNWLDRTGPGSVGNVHSPYYAANNTGATVILQWANLGATQSGFTVENPRINAPPKNHGCCEQLTLTGATIQLNSDYPAVAYTAGGNIGLDPNGTVWYDVRWVFDHELAHTTGLGHTNDFNETMHQAVGPNYNNQYIGAGVGDVNGMSCEYEVVNCG